MTSRAPLRRLLGALLVASSAASLATAAQAAATDPEAAVDPRGSEPEDAPWTWERLVTTIERTHPLAHAARADLATFEAQLSQARWAYFPSFRLEGAASVTPEVTGDALESFSTWDRVGYFLRVRVEMVQPIWTFGKIGALQRAAASGVDVGQAVVDAARWELRVRASQAYMGRLLAMELSRIMETGRTWIDRAERRMERLREEDSIDYDQLEHLRLRTRVAEFYVLDADNRLLETRSKEGLRILLSLPPGTPVPLDRDELTPLRFELRGVEEYVAMAFESEPTLRAARHGASAQGALADARAAELWPDLVIVGEAGVSRANRVEDQPSRFANDPFNRSSAAAALALRWNLDVPQRLFRADEARARARRSGYQVEAQRDVIELRVRQLHQDLANKRELLEVLARSEKAAQGWLTATWDTYDAGFGNFRDYMDALVQFYSRKVSYLQTVFEHNLLVFELSRAVGHDITAE